MGPICCYVDRKLTPGLSLLFRSERTLPPPSAPVWWDRRVPGLLETVLGTYGCCWPTVLLHSLELSDRGLPSSPRSESSEARFTAYPFHTWRQGNPAPWRCQHQSFRLTRWFTLASVYASGRTLFPWRSSLALLMTARDRMLNRVYNSFALTFIPPCTTV